MNFVQPIRDPYLVEDIANYLRKRSERNYILFLLGIYTGRRISDILKLRVREVRNRNALIIREQKTGKQIEILINPILKKAINDYTENMDDNDYLIKSRQGHNKPISREMAYKILKSAAKEFKIESIGTHTMRKTFGYHFYKQFGDVVKLMKIFNHNHPSVTLRYIGIEQEEIDAAIKKFRIF